MSNQVGIEMKFLHFFSCLPVIFLRCRSGKEELCFAFRCVSFYGNYSRRSNQHPVLACLGSDERTRLNAETFSQLGGYDYCAAFSHFHRFHNVLHRNYIRFFLTKTAGRDFMQMPMLRA